MVGVEAYLSIRKRVSDTGLSAFEDDDENVREPNDKVQLIKFDIIFPFLCKLKISFGDSFLNVSQYPGKSWPFSFLASSLQEWTVIMHSLKLKLCQRWPSDACVELPF